MPDALFAHRVLDPRATLAAALAAGKLKAES
jgi:hypothetical protein